DNWSSITPRLQGASLDEPKPLAAVSPRTISVVEDLYLSPSSRVPAFYPDAGEQPDRAIVLPQNDNLSMSSLYLRFRMGEALGATLRLALESVDGNGDLFDAIDIVLERGETGVFMDVCGRRELLLEGYDGWTDAWLLIDN